MVGDIVYFVDEGELDALVAREPVQVGTLRTTTLIVLVLLVDSFVLEDEVVRVVNLLEYLPHQDLSLVWLLARRAPWS